MSFSVHPAAAQSEKVKAAMQPFVDNGDVAGLVTFIGNKDGVVDVQTLGMADIDARRPIERGTIFRIASMSKPITALAIMQLVEQGKVNVNDAVENYLPEFKGQMLLASKENDTVVLKRLLIQRTGLPNSDGSARRKALHDVSITLQ